MNTEAIYSTDLCDHVRHIEELAERRIACIVFIEGDHRLGFGFPGGAEDRTVTEVMRRIGEAAQDALKSL